VFADLIGSTSLHERLDPESVTRVMDRYYKTVRGPVEAHGGTVVQLLGDGVMCAFGVPRVAEDDAIRAVRAAVGIQDAFREFVRSERELVGSVGLRVAVNTGEVVVTDDHAAGIGDPLNVAARLQQEAQDGDVLISESTRRLVSELVTLEQVGVLALRGRAESVAAYRVMSLDKPSGTSATAFVGRDDELRRIMAVHDATVANRRTRLAVILGSPGLGKSRLMDEVARRLGDGATILTAQCDAAGGATFAPIARALRAFLRIEEGTGGHAARAAIEVALPGDEAERARIAEGIAALLGGTPASPEETFFVVRRLLSALAAVRPVVLAIDDLHWAEPLLLDLTEHLVQWGSDLPLLVLAAARPELRETRSSLATSGGLVAEVVTLAGLDAVAATRLAANVIGADQLPAAVAGRVLATSEGNPLFVGELVRMLVHDGALKREGDRWTAGVELARLEMPPTIQALLAARIERLRPEDRTVLERAAVVGRQFSRAAVTHLLPREIGDLDAQLEALRRSELIEPDTGWFLGEPALRFHHVLVRDAAYRGVLKNTRAELHARFAGWLEARAGEAVEHDETIGWHLEQAHQNLRELGPLDEHGRALGERAARYLAAAGRRALARDDLPPAAGLLGRALDRLETADTARADLTLDWCEALLAAGNVAPAAPAIEQLDAFAGESARLRAWHTCFAGQLAALTDPQALRATADAVAAAADALAAASDAAGEAKAHSVHALALARLGRVGACEAALDRALAAARRARDRRRSNAVLASAPLAALWGPSPVTRASGRCLDVVRVLRITQGAPAVEAVALRCQGVLEALRGRTEAARRMLASSRRMVEELGITQRLLEADVFTGLVDLLEGDAAAAERTLRAAYDGLREHGLGIDAAQASALLGRALLALGRAEEAEALSHQSEALAGDDLKAAIAWRGVRAEALARRGEHASAVDFARTAVDLAAATDALLDHADARCALAAALRAAGRSAEAAAEEQRAIELWDAKGATLLAERARQDMGRVVHEDAVRDVRAQPARPARRRLLPNAAAAFTTRLNSAIAARDAGALASLLADEIEVVNHPTGTVLDRHGVLTTWQLLLRGEDPTCRHEALATLGDSLALCRMSISASRFRGARFDVAAYERQEIVLIEVDANGRERWGENFTDDRLGDAVVRLYGRYAEILPDGPARERGAGTARSVGVALLQWKERDFLDSYVTAVDPAIEFVDHQPVGLGSARGADRFLRGLRAFVDLTDDATIRVDDVLGLRPDALLIRQTNFGTARASGGPYERQHLSLWGFGVNGLISRLEWFVPDREDEALARFDELTGEPSATAAPFRVTETRARRIRSNAATANQARTDAVIAARDAEAIPTLLSDDTEVLYHPTGAVYGRDGLLASWRALMRVPDSTFRNEPLAALGDSLALFRQTVRASGVVRGNFDIGIYELDGVLLSEVDAQGRRCRAEVFAIERLGDAVARLYARHAELLPDGPERARTAATALAVARVLQPPDAGSYDVIFAPDHEFIDHRRLGLGAARGANRLRRGYESVAEVADHLGIRYCDVLGFRSGALLVHQVTSGTVRASGGRFENEFFTLLAFGPDGRVTRSEWFDDDCADQALACFDELTGGPSATAAPLQVAEKRARRIRPNAATANIARLDAAIVARDGDAIAAIFGNESETFDHTTGAIFGQQGAITAWQGMLRAQDGTCRHEPLATVGDSLALCRQWMSGSGLAGKKFDVGAWESERVVLVEVAAQGRRRATEVFAPNHLGGAVVRLYERYSELLPDGPERDRGAAIARAAGAGLGPFDLDRYATGFAPEIVYVDRRTLGLPPAYGAEAVLHLLGTMLEVADDVTTRIDDVLALRSEALLVRWTNAGIDRVGGGVYERPFLWLGVFGAEGLLTRIELFDADRADQALARFDVLTSAQSAPSAGTAARAADGRRGVRPNAATTHVARVDAAIAARDADALPALLTDQTETIYHPSGAVYGRDGLLASWRAIMRGSDATLRHEPLGSLGDSLALFHHSVSASGVARGSFDVGRYELDVVVLIEADARDRAIRVEVFADDHLGRAIARLYERYAELLPNGSARDRATATAQSVAAMLGPISVARWAPVLAPSLEFADHRHVSFESGTGAEAYLHALQALLDVTQDDATYIDDVLALRPDALLVRYRHVGTARIGGGAFERLHVFLWVFAADGLVARLEFFEVDDENAALARFEELTAEQSGAASPSRVVEKRDRRVHPNAATANAARVDAALAAHDADVLPSLLTDDTVSIEHASGVTYERQGVLASWRSLLNARDPSYRHEPLATLGDSLALCRLSTSASSFRGRTFDVGAYEQEYLLTIEADADGRRRRMEGFAANRLGDAIVRLYERYAELLPDGPARVRAAATARAVAATSGPLDPDRSATAWTPAIESVDHRILGTWSARGAKAYDQELRSLLEVADNVLFTDDEVLCLRPDALLTHRIHSGTDRAGGGRYERSFLWVRVFGTDGLISRVEFFDADREDEAIARFEALTAQEGTARAVRLTRRVRPNAATANAARFDAVIAARDADALPALFADVAEFVERPTDAVYDRDGVLLGMRAALHAREFSYLHEPLATLGDALALCRVSMSASGLKRGKLDVGAFETEHIDVIEVDAQGRRRWVERFASDRLGDAVARLYERYAELLPAGPARDRVTGTARSVAAFAGPFDPDGRYVAAYAPDIEVIDHRVLGTWFAHGAEALLRHNRSWLEVAEDLTVREDDILALEPAALLTRRTFSGIDRAGGGAFERTFIHLSTFGDDGRITRLEHFDVDREDLALARFDELTAAPPTTARIENAATRSIIRFAEAWEARDWARVAATLAREFRVSDRRTLMHLELDREQHLATLRMMFEMVSCRLSSELLATRGERLALFRQRFEGSDRNVGPSEAEWLWVLEMNDRGERVAAVMIDPDDLDAAYAELDARYLAGEAAPFRHVKVISAFKRAFAARDWDAMASATAPDFVLVDHRPLGWGTLDGPTYLESLKALAGLAPDTRFRTDHLWVSARGLMFVNVLHGTRDGGAFEEPRLHVYEFDDQGRACRQDFYTLKQLDEARARFGEVHSPRAASARRDDPLARAASADVRSRATARRIRPNGAVANAARCEIAATERDLEALAALIAPDAEFVHHPTGTTYDRRAALDQEVMFTSIDTVAHEALATLGESLALCRRSVSFRGVQTGDLDVGPATVEAVVLIESDEQERIRRLEVFAESHLGEATTRLYERYADLLPDGPMRARAAATARSVAVMMGPFDPERFALAFAPAIEVVDHRTLGTWSGHGAEEFLQGFRALLELADDVAIHEDDILGVQPDVLLLRRTHTGTARAGGGRYERPFIHLMAFGPDGLEARCEYFDVDRADEALACFDEMTAEPPTTTRIENAATRSILRFVAAWDARDFETAVAPFARDFRLIDRRTMMHLELDFEEHLASLRFLFEMASSRFSSEVLATRGERLALFRQRFEGSDGSVGPSEAEWVWVLGMNDRGERIAAVMFDPNDLDAAYDELDARFAAGEAARCPVMEAGPRTTQAVAARDWGKLASLFAPDFVIDDHRLLGWGTLRSGEEYVARVRALVELRPDVFLRINHVLALDDRGALLVSVWQGSESEGAFEIPVAVVSQFAPLPDGRITRWDLYDLDELDVARKLYGELRAAPR
jgi:class 3 adenylate cyclase